MVQRTLAILKPDCVRKNFTGKVIDQIVNAGFKIVGMKMVTMDAKTAGEFYAVHKERPFYKSLVEFMSSGRCIPLVLEKERAIEDFRELIGATDPAEAESGTVRKLYAESKQDNIVHGSDSQENAVTEIHFFFSERELIPNS
ncbi:nucleoside diphosphate kinase [bacterium BMS3Abin05]|nr:nucleoside diphosphate kinase [bacterium BMS3Abin05]GBE27104.1 nucleoside diphosphate kinase [bacterium BMS3Bbin03]HDK35697.1 nucleoside-diphosphate kinase [Bacteroidota bacterium]HDZ11440.1 nucleoside-diphosphate kinase [Bacteroidota bacterium]